MTEMPTCQVCEERESVMVCCSGLGPISVAYCAECYTSGKEPRWLAKETIESVGGYEYLADWAKEIVDISLGIPEDTVVKEA